MQLAMKWGRHHLDFGKKTHVMGVLNVTPDSFSDGGFFLEAEKAVEHGIAMVGEGADIIDVGGESTRPFSGRVSAEEEIDRVIPVIEGLSREISVPISIDTYKSRVAHEALSAGASIINDISALRFDPEMARLAAVSKVPVVLMHMKGTPENMQKNPIYHDLISEILTFLRDAVERATDAGIPEDLIMLDPGIGFGKSFDDNLTIINRISAFSPLGRPVLLGTSNKSFIGEILGKNALERVTGTMATIAAGVMNGAHVVRVHQVKKAVETVRVVDALRRGTVREPHSSGEGESG